MNAKAPVACLATLLTLALPASAAASSASVAGGNLDISASAGEINDVVILQGGDAYVIEDDGHSLTSGTGCGAETIGGVVQGARCTGVTAIRVRLGDRDDSLRLPDTLAAPVTYSGGDGTDSVLYFHEPVAISNDGVANDGPSGKDNVGADVEDLQGSTAADTLKLGPLGGELLGGEGDDTLAGGAGDDVIESGYVTPSGLDFGDFNPQGKDTVTCGAGEDSVYADYADVVAADCEIVERPSASGPRTYLVKATNGADHIGPVPFGWGPATVYAYGGDDTIRTPWFAVVHAGAGNDRIIGEDFTHQVFHGDSGNDRIDVRDSHPDKNDADTVYCGSGTDLVYANKDDRVARDCERVKRR